MSGFLTSKKLPVIILAAVVLAVVLWFALSPRTGPHADSSSTATSSAGTGPADNPDVVFPVEVAVVRRGDLIKSLTTNGTIRARREVEVVARVGGGIDSVSVFNGRYVHQGDLLVRLDDTECRLAYEKAASSLLAAQIEYRTLSTSPFIEDPDTASIRLRVGKATEGLHQLEELWQKRAISVEEYNRMRRDLETELGVSKAHRTDVVASKSGLTLARETFERAKLDLESTEIKAPFAGYVADCDLAAGMRVRAENVLMKLVDVSTLYVDVEVLESEIGKLAVGRKAHVVVDALQGQSFAGTICAINPIVDSRSKTVKVTVVLRDGRGGRGDRFVVIRPGMFTVVKLQSEVLPNSLLVPKEALLVRDQRTLVFIAQGGLAKWQYVQAADGNSEYFVAQSGVSAGDTVIISGHYTLAHDARIRVERGR